MNKKRKKLLTVKYACGNITLNSVNKNSTLHIYVSESRRRWECGTEIVEEWVWEMPW